MSQESTTPVREALRAMRCAGDSGIVHPFDRVGRDRGNCQSQKLGTGECCCARVSIIAHKAESVRTVSLVGDVEMNVPITKQPISWMDEVAVSSSIHRKETVSAAIRQNATCDKPYAVVHGAFPIANFRQMYRNIVSVCSEDSTASLMSQITALGGSKDWRRMFDVSDT